jgi:hypothetical protein
MELERRGFIKGLAALTALVAGGFVAKPAISKEIIAKGSGALPSTGKEVNEVDEVMAAASEVPGFEPDPTPALADSLDKEGLFDRPGRIIGVDGGGELDAENLQIDPAWIYQKRRDMGELTTYPADKYTAEHPPWPNKRVLVFDSAYGPFILVAKAKERPDFYMTADGRWIHTAEITRAFSEVKPYRSGHYGAMSVWMKPESMSFATALQKRRDYDAKSRTAGTGSDSVHNSPTVRRETASEDGESSG